MRPSSPARRAAGAGRPLLWLAIALVLAAGGYAAYALRAAAPAAEYSSATVARGDIVARVTATGTLSALVTVQVGSQVSGRVQALYADFSAPVHKGQLIAKIDPQLFQAEVEQQQANLVSAEANLLRAQVQARDAQRQARRADELAPRGLISQSERDTTRASAEAAEATVAAARASLGQARAALQRARIHLAYTDIISPTDGVVISRSVDVGQTVAASLQAPTLFTIAQDLRKMQVDTNVAESDVGRLQAGMKASFTVDAYPGERFQGRVRQVRDAATTTQNVVTYDAVLDVANEDLRLKPGMTANVTFVYASKQDVLRVPNAALRFRPPANATGLPAGADKPPQRRSRGEESPDAPRTVWRLRAGAAEPVQIRTGISDGSYTEIVDGGLQEGDEVVTDMVDDGKAKLPPAMRMF